jgi:hypothetical protein
VSGFTALNVSVMLFFRNGSGPSPSPCEPASEATNWARPLATSPALMLSQSPSVPRSRSVVGLKPPVARFWSVNLTDASAGSPAVNASPSTSDASA